jgi:23S rRNA A2030 N6-methylase RlmJ
MADQRRNAANIGDVIKHALLPEFVLDAATLRPDLPIHYIETHAGFYGYSEHLLKNKEGEWSGERAWSLGAVLEFLKQGGDLGDYGEVLRRATKVCPFMYPGSLKLVAEVLPETQGTCLAGFDIGCAQVRSFPPSIDVKRGDGYDRALRVLRSTKTARTALIFVDPFWSDEQADCDLHEIIGLANEAAGIVVWYPVSRGCSDWRSRLLKSGFRSLEFRYEHYKVAPWAGQDLKGAGMAFRGFSNEVKNRLSAQSSRLVAAFAGRRLGGRLLDLSDEFFG